MDPRFLDKLREEFPDAEDLAYRRFMSERSIFWEGRNRRRYPKALIFAALVLACSYALSAGRTLKLILKEQLILNEHFTKLLVFLISLFLLLLS